MGFLHRDFSLRKTRCLEHNLLTYVCQLLSCCEFPRLDIALQSVGAEPQHALDLANKGEFARVVVNPVLIAVARISLTCAAFSSLSSRGVAFSAAWTSSLMIARSSSVDN